MDPMYDSSGAESIKNKKRKGDPTEDEFSEDD